MSTDVQNLSHAWPVCGSETLGRHHRATRWYAVSTRHRQERTVQQQLIEKSVETFLPTVTRRSRWKDRLMAINWPLFPGYCFARFDPQDRRDIVTCRGVVRIVSVGGALAPVDETELNSIRILLGTSFN